MDNSCGYLVDNAVGGRVAGGRYVLTLANVGRLDWLREPRI